MSAPKACCYDKDGKEYPTINDNVLIEIGAARLFMGETSFFWSKRGASCHPIYKDRMNANIVAMS